MQNGRRMTQAAALQRAFGLECVGREDDLARLANRFDQVTTAGGAFVAVTGPAGIGKSTLLLEAQRRFTASGALVLVTRCRAGLSSLQPIMEVVQTLLGRLGETGGAPELLGEAEALLGQLSGQLPTGNDVLGPELGPRNTLDRLARLLREAAKLRPIALVLHDIDVADPATKRAVAFLGLVLTSPPELTRQRFAGLLVVSARDLGDVGWEPRWSDGVDLLHLELAGMDRAGLRDYLSSDAVLDKVLAVTGGVPQELAALVGGDFAGGRANSPLTLAEPAEASVLSVLAVLGRPVDAETLTALTRLPQDALSRAITRLVERQTLEKTVVGGALRVAYRRVGDERSVYEQLERGERRELHASVGYYLHGDETELEACAEHLLLGHCGQDAVDAALAAAQRLEISFCLERAADLYERALSLAKPETHAELLRALCSLYENMAQLDRALEIAEQLSKAAPSDLEAILRVAHLRLRRGDFSAARNELARLDAQAERQLAPPALRARILAEQAEAHFMAGEREASREAAELGLALCPQLPAELPTRLELRNTLGKIYLEQREPTAARQAFAENLASADAAGLLAETARAHIQLGLSAMSASDYEAARRHYEAGRQQASTLGEHRYLGACLQHLGVLAERRRDYGQAIEFYQRAVSSWKKAGHRSYLAWVGLDLAKLYLDLGDVARAQAMCNLADKLADMAPPLATRFNRELVRGRLAKLDCRPSDAAAHFEHAERLAQDAGQTERAARARIENITLALERLEVADARAMLSELMQQELPDPVRLRALLCSAHAELGFGNIDLAQQVSIEALELASCLDDAEAAWEAHYRLALVARQQGREAEARRRLAEAARIERGVRDGVPKELRATMAEQPLRVALRGALASGEQQVVAADDRRELTSAPASTAGFAAIVGAHPRVRQVLAQVDKVAVTDATVLIRGESGTGKELIADAIHARSARADHALVKVNCGALVESLLLSELFGHERGAFTGATQRRIGRFELAHGGTIFLDEIGDISPKTQVALLRVLQDRTFERVGGTTAQRVDVRIIFATNRNLEGMVADGLFREDLYYRLRGVQIELPPLRERSSDIGLLAAHVLHRTAKERECSPKTLDSSALQLLSQHGWPGNVRELENVLRSVSLFAEEPVLTANDFADYPEFAPAARPASSLAGSPVSAYQQLRAEGLSLRDLKKQVEASCIRKALDESDGNITRAADLLGMKRPRLSQLIKEHGLADR